MKNVLSVSGFCLRPALEVSTQEALAFGAVEMSGFGFRKAQSFLFKSETPSLVQPHPLEAPFPCQRVLLLCPPEGDGSGGVCFGHPLPVAFWASRRGPVEQPGSTGTNPGGALGSQLAQAEELGPVLPFVSQSQGQRSCLPGAWSLEELGGLESLDELGWPHP